MVEFFRWPARFWPFLPVANFLGAEAIHPTQNRRVRSRSLINRSPTGEIGSMNGGGPNIETIRPFNEAFELMNQILFRPFELKKWFVIGFAAWLSNLGNGNYNFNMRGDDWKDVPGAQEVRDTVSQIPHWILIYGIIGFIALLVALIVLVAWLRSRGRFIFVDCIAKNRGAIAEPWREFREQGNSYFLFSLAVGVIMMIVLLAAALPFLVPIIRSGGALPHLHDVYILCVIALWVAVAAVLVIAWALIGHFMIAIMYRRRCLAREGFRASVALIATYPGEITLYCLFWIALTIGTVFASCIVILATCCIALLPYIGTVITLPIYVVLRGFGLRFIRQFGPDYDVWAGNGASPPAPPPLPPPLPS
ncbi:MAG TPA: hypothetical protein VKS98_06455 [Chthoniobacterales bacterium]|nr:hypothetical protein [Chthoniobacterales bacterium]